MSFDFTHLTSDVNLPLDKFFQKHLSLRLGLKGLFSSFL